MQSAKTISEYSAIILINAKGEILLQLRDNNPEIVDPNKLSLFAGGVLAGESKEHAAQRELFEETTIWSDNLEYLFTYHADTRKFGREAKSHIFLLQDVDEALVDVQEGQGYRKIKGVTDLDKLDFALISKEILRTYFDKYPPMA
jgi:8-oxo-dGTP pyrophosphatase MutT (NUDIX family)